jgi:hypothetical protein
VAKSRRRRGGEPVGVGERCAFTSTYQDARKERFRQRRLAHARRPAARRARPGAVTAAALGERSTLPSLFPSEYPPRVPRKKPAIIAIGDPRINQPILTSVTAGK